ncbi:MAG TPA: hypothetical protein VNZ52_11050 [Candidatus Thermoplasmatota archaeon]|nr:hypothetical protein [Candidatus Thermoplasmatota archaeon]
MLPKTSLGNIGTLTALALAGCLVLVPTVGALSIGMHVNEVGLAKKAGLATTYGQFWIGSWMKQYGWGGLDQYLATAKAENVIPVIEWYYWGDAITVNCVKYGCNGLSQADWNSMGKTLAQKVHATMGDKPVIIVVETEFNKGGVQSWEDFDGLLAAHIGMLRYHAPNAKYYLGFGAWGDSEWSRFDRAMATADGSGFQTMRGRPHDSDASYLGATDFALKTVKLLKEKFGKPVLLHDIALSTYEGKEWAQERVLKDFHAKMGEFRAAGLEGMIYRAYKDDPNFPLNNYYGYGERYMGLHRADGSAKPGWNAWKALATESGSPDPTPDPTPSPFTATFGNVKVQEWWVQASVSTNGHLARVEAAVNGGAWIVLDNKGWGHAKSFHVPAGATVQFRAVSSDGAASYSQKYPGPGAAPTTFQANWWGVKGNEWWQQVQVSGGSGIAKVEVQINGGDWKPLDKQSWGGYAKSYHAWKGSKVQFRATDTTGKLAWSSVYTWPVA